MYEPRYSEWHTLVISLFESHGLHYFYERPKGEIKQEGLRLKVIISYSNMRP